MTLRRTTNFPFPDISERLGLRNLGNIFRTNPHAKVLALFFSGSLDGRTYLESANELAEGFSIRAHIVINGAGPDLFMSTPMVTTFILDFLSNK